MGQGGEVGVLGKGDGVAILGDGERAARAFGDNGLIQYPVSNARRLDLAFQDVYTYLTNGTCYGTSGFCSDQWGSCRLLGRSHVWRRCHFDFSCFVVFIISLSRLPLRHVHLKAHGIQRITDPHGGLIHSLPFKFRVPRVGFLETVMQSAFQ